MSGHDQTPEERGFQEGGRYVGPNLDPIWHRIFGKWCPYTFAMTVQTGFIGLLAWLVSMMMSPTDEAPIRFIWGSLFYICCAAAILLPLISLVKLNWAGQFLWIVFFFWYVVFQYRQTWGISWDVWLLWVVVGSAVSEILAGIWERSGHQESLLSYRVKTAGRYLVYAVIIGGTLVRGGISTYKYFYDLSHRRERLEEYLAEIKKEEEAVAAAKRKEEAAKQKSQPAENPVPPAIAAIKDDDLPPSPQPIPTREPDARFTFGGQPAAAGPPSLSYLFTDISFESGEGPSPDAASTVIKELRGGISPTRRFTHEQMWPSNVALATELSKKRIEQGAVLPRLNPSGMECRLWVANYGMELLGSVIFIRDARVQADCRLPR